jgi:hypothetical protein
MQQIEGFFQECFSKPFPRIEKKLGFPVGMFLRRAFLSLRKAL